MLIVIGMLAVFTGIGVYLTERVDRPARRAEREAQSAQ